VHAHTREMIIRLCEELSKQSLDAGAETIAAQLAAGPLATAASLRCLRSRRSGGCNPGWFRYSLAAETARSSWRRFAVSSRTDVGRPTLPTGSLQWHRHLGFKYSR
jgi:hypothetical protein